MTFRPRRHLRSLARALALVLAASRASSAEPPQPEPTPGAAPAEEARAARETVEPARRGTAPPTAGQTALLAAGFAGATTASAWALWWRGNAVRQFEVRHEAWFGRETYAGGADKASHAVFGYLGGELFRRGYARLGHRPRASRWLAAGSVAVGAALVEAGDGWHGFGFSWEDLAITAAGGVAGAAIDEAGLGDTLGMRWGVVPKRLPKERFLVPGDDGRYSGDIHTVDVKLAGLLPRLGVRPGPARFLLVSATYGTKGYAALPVGETRRQVGLEVGLNVEEVLLAVGVSRETWWGPPLLAIGRSFRIPYTAVGFRYELGSARWVGPDTGETY